MPKKLRWLRSPTGSNGRPWKNWRLSRNRIRCWPGTASSSPTSSTDRSFANPGVVPELTRKPSGWWCGWRRKIPPALGSDGGQYSPPPGYSTGSQAEADDELERLYPCSHGGVGGDRLLHGGSAYAKRFDYVLRAVFHSFGEPQDMLGPGFLCFCWLKQEEDEEEPTTVQKHSREGYNIATLLFFFLFLDNLLRR